MERNNLMIGIDIGGTKCAVVLGDSRPEIFDKISFKTLTEKGPGYTLEKIMGNISKILEHNNINSDQISGIGISCGGPLDSEKGIIQSPPNLIGWDDIHIVNLLEQKFNIKTYLQNDANACAAAEWKWGAGQGCKNMIFLTFGTGMGAGLILNGSLYTGAGDLAGEVGHIRLAEDGPAGHGKKGSFEGFCSGGGIARLARQEVSVLLEQGKTAGFWTEKNDIENITAKDVGMAAARGDVTAVKIMKKSGRYLGKGLSILIDILNPEKIIIGSIFLRCRNLLQPEAKKVIKKEALAKSAAQCEIKPAGLGEEIGDYACLAAAYYNF